MRQDQVRKLEEACEAVLADVVARYADYSPDPQVFRFMAKAAIAVLEGAEAMQSPPEPD